MPMLKCNACNKEFEDGVDQKLHYKSDWHRYNLKRKVAGLPGVVEALFTLMQTAAAQVNDKISKPNGFHNCSQCGKGYRSSKALSQHLHSRSHLIKAAQGVSKNDGRIAEVFYKNKADGKDTNSNQPFKIGYSNREVEETANAVTGLNINEDSLDGCSDEDDIAVDPSCCFMCDIEHDDVDSCITHMHKQHGFFIPDVEFLKDPEGLLTYLGLKVKRDFMCLYCNDGCAPFSSIEAVRKHMEAKHHCKVHYGDGDDKEEVELEEFYDYTKSYPVTDQGKLVPQGDILHSVQLGNGGSELIVTKLTDGNISSRTIGSREFMRYYRQKPRPSFDTASSITATLASRYRSMGLATVQSKEHMIRMKVLKQMSRTGLEELRTRVGLKNNVIRHLPRNVPY